MVRACSATPAACAWPAWAAPRRADGSSTFLPMAAREPESGTTTIEETASSSSCCCGPLIGPTALAPGAEVSVRAAPKPAIDVGPVADRDGWIHTRDCAARGHRIDKRHAVRAGDHSELTRAGIDCRDAEIALRPLRRWQP